MNLNFSTIGTLFRHELRMILRDRRTILMAVLLPMIVTPLMLAGSSWTRKKREHALQTRTYHYAVTGTNTAVIFDLVERARERVASGNGTNDAPAFRLEESTVTNALAALHQGEIDFVLEGSIEDPQGVSTNAAVEAPFKIRLIYRGDRDDSSTGMERMRKWLEETRHRQRGELLGSHGFPVGMEQVAIVDKTNLASDAQSAGLALGRFITLFLLIFILSGGAIVANDLLAGEKERGTLETLLTTSAARIDIIAAKHLVILVVAAFITCMQAANLLLYVALEIIPISSRFAAAVSPGKAMLLLLLFLPVAGLVSSVLLLVSGHAKTYKEAQLYFMPLMFLAILPALAPMLPDVPLRSVLVLVPIANIALAARDVLVGWYDWPMIATAWGVTVGLAVWLTRISVAFLSAERLVMANGGRGASPEGPVERFGQRVAIWFGVLWAVVWLVNSYMARADVRVQITVNLVVLFFSASLLMVWRYKLDVRQTMALRAPRPMVWLGVLCGIPGGLLTASAVARLTTSFIPVSQESLEEFARAILPEDVSLAQLLFFLAVLPGFFEEVTFRGLLLHGLHRRLRPVALVLVVGLVFGVFHFALFRLPSTAFLGMLFAALTLLTGSIYPAMIWHAGNNALGLLSEHYGLPLSDLDAWMYGAGMALLAVAFWIFWRERTPYPGLKLRRPGSAVL